MHKLEKFGLYPIVPNLQWLTALLNLEVKTIQLRIKPINQKISNYNIESAIETAVKLANQAGAKLFINDHWQLAIKYQAYGVHLGQTDLITVNWQTIIQNNLKIGISTHSLDEVNHAINLPADYLGFGPIFQTISKKTLNPAQGTNKLKQMCQISPVPIVAIGGINLNNITEVLKCGCQGVAIINGITGGKALPDENLAELVNHWKIAIN